ncbi:MAG: hypothetical protein PVJ27_00575 [Candidatus Brocadiaceae bacterium]|jgi:predicted RNA-binding Zn-ribbon protein involved in translation (DUF1610 family)
MGTGGIRGRVYRCPRCGAEVAVLAARVGDFAPRCCNTAMVLLPRRLAFYVCPVCGAEIAVIRAGAGEFRARCCNRDMIREAA